MSDNKPVSVSVLDRKYQLACPAGEVNTLKAAAEELDSRMRDLRKRNKSSNGEKLAVVAALNLTSELLLLRDTAPALDDVSSQLNAIEDTLREALSPLTASSQPETVDK